MAEPKWKRKNNGIWTERPKETTRRRIQKNRIQYRTHPTDVERKRKRKKRGRPEEENFSQETGLPDYPTGLTSVHTSPHKVEVVAVLRIPHGTSHVVFQLNLCQEQLDLPSTLSCVPTDGVIPVGGGRRNLRWKCRSTISNSKEF